MLVLTRRPGESIIIGDGIKLTIVNVGPGRVKIGIEAPPSVRVDRSEIHDRIQQEKSSDVLEAVSSGNIAGVGADQPTMVVSGPETGVLPNRVADQLTGQPPVPPAPDSESGPTGIRKYRSPRKPR